MPTAPYGTWPSPISAETATRSGIRFVDTIQVDGDEVYWVESRPHEGGRSAIVRREAGGATTDVGTPEFDARTRVHEYGGGAYAVAGGIVYAADFEDQRWYRIEGDTATPITPQPEEPAASRYADVAIGDGWGIAVAERHGLDGEPVNQLVRIDLSGGSAPVVVATGHDFYAAPRLSPDRTRLAWLTWDHPNMPWDGTDLWVADVSGVGELTDQRRIAGGPGESVLQPEWSPDGKLHFASDRTGWWNLYRLDGEGGVPIHPVAAEHSQAMWNLGLRRYAFLGDGRLVAVEESTTGDRILVLAGGVREVPTPFDSFGGAMAVLGTSVFLVASAFDRPTAVVGVDVDTGAHEILRAPDGPAIRAGLISVPEAITFETPDGPAHALYYPPADDEYQGPGDHLPPMIVNVHGGPTSRLTMDLDPERLFWTSRGFGIVDVDYGGSTGHGRAYRQRLKGQWGVVDVRDCALAAAEVARRGLADPGRMVIRGGSAGGFTVLMALAVHDEFAAGSARYAVTNLESLAADTHKFESRYLDSLIGPYPERRDLYLDRSPVTHAAEITAPVLLLQGLDDRVVPPSQPEAMRDLLRANGVPVGYIEFPGEGHGFRSAGARIRSLEAELAFFGQVLGFDPADDLEPVEL
jgi:dipeptidyl aminopeptidase/acylaminoacyl peptidase